MARHRMCSSYHYFMQPLHITCNTHLVRLAPVSYVNFFSKTDNLSKIEIYKLYLEVEVLGLDIRDW